MREQFVATAADLVENDPRVAVVLADISSASFQSAMRRHPDRVLNVGIREQLMVSTAGGLALTGMRPIVHSYAPFTVSRAYEQLKLDLTYQDVGVVVVSIGASYDDTGAGTTHFAPEDVALFDTLPGWQVHVPAHLDEVDPLLRDAVADGGRHYIRLTEYAVPRQRIQPVSEPSALVVAVGPTVANVIEAARGLNVSVLPITTVRPFPAQALRRAVFELTGEADVVLVEPYRTGTSAHEVAAALVDVRHRLLALGVGRRDLRRYGTAAEHDAAHGIDVASLRRSISDFVEAGYKMPDGE
ncbi:MAG: transketolase family protein [Acidothermaceae bacterium]